jgi:hypothetical protein
LRCTDPGVWISSAKAITAELPLDVDRNWVISPPLTGQAQVGLEMFLDDSIQDDIGWIPGAVKVWGKYFNSNACNR